MTAVVILIILATLAGTFMLYGVGKARVNNAVFDAAALLTTAQLRAVSTGTPHYVFIHQSPDMQIRIHTLERPDLPPAITNWDTLDLTDGIDQALKFERPKPPPPPTDPPEPPPAPDIIVPITRDQLVLSAGAGLDRGGLAFLDLDSTRIKRPLPAPFQAITLTTEATNGTPNEPTPEMIFGCNFCVSVGEHTYGVLRFNANGTVEVETGEAPAGAVIAFASNGDDEEQLTPKLLTISAPAGAVTVF
jgi:type II secretory pathway pseudopilin PulG